MINLGSKNYNKSSVMKIFKNLVVSVACVVGFGSVGMAIVDNNPVNFNSAKDRIEAHNILQGARDNVRVHKVSGNQVTGNNQYVVPALLGREFRWPWRNSPWDNNNYSNQYRLISETMTYYSNGMYNDIYSHCGNLLIFQKQDGSFIILQSGIQDRAANDFIELLKQNFFQLYRKNQTEMRWLKRRKPNVPDTKVNEFNFSVWGGGNVIAQIGRLQNQNIDIELVENSIKDLSENKNISLENIKSILYCIKQYIQQISHLATVPNASGQKIGPQQNLGINSQMGRDSAVQFLDRIESLADSVIPEQTKIELLNDILKRVFYFISVGERRKQAEAIAYIVNNTINIQNSIASITDALLWIKYALHTEVQLVALMQSQIVQLADWSPIFSLLQPCWSCEGGAQVGDRWTNRFLAFRLDNGGIQKERRKEATKTNLQQYKMEYNKIVQPGKAPVYITIKKDE